MSHTMSVALVGPTTARGGAVLAALEPIASALDLEGFAGDQAGATFDWRGERPVRALADADLTRFDAVIAAEPVDLPGDAPPCLSLVPSAAPVADETVRPTQRIADPVAAAVARIVAPLQAALTGIDATVLDAASVHDRPGMDGLRDQTIALLNFRPLPETVFDRRLAFDLLLDNEPREAAVRADLASLCPAAPMADVRRVIVPAFIGAAIDLRLRGAVSRADLQASLDAAGCEPAEGLADVIETGGLRAHRPTATADGVRVWLLVDDLRWGAGTAALEFLARIRSSAV